MKKQTILERITASGVVAVMRGTEADKVVDIAQALEQGGIKALEITCDQPQAMDIIRQLTIEFKNTDVIIGAGTVLDGPTARSAILAGAEFVFGPTLNYDVIEVANRYGKVVIPGVMTPTEMVNAYQAGADLVKVFPAASLGANYIKKVKGPLEQIPIIPTGGINLDNAGEFITAGAEAVGVGGSLLNQEAIANKDYEVLTRKAKEFVELIEEIRKER